MNEDSNTQWKASVRTSFGSTVGRVVRRGHAISPCAIHVEDVPACRLPRHAAQRSSSAQQRAHQVGLHHLRYFLD